MKYYLHDSNSFNDEKITELFINFGYEGLGLFYTLLEKLAAQEKPVKTLVLKRQLKIGKKLEKCWEFLEQIELISTSNGDTFNERLMDFAGKYKVKNEKNAKRISDWRKKREQNHETLDEVCAKFEQSFANVSLKFDEKINIFQEKINILKSKGIDNETIEKIVTCYTLVTERVRNARKVNRSKVNRSKVNKEEEIKLNFSSISESVWTKWTNYKLSQFNEKYKTVESEQIALNKLVEISKNNNEIAEKIVNNSITNIYKGLFELKEQNNLFSSQKQSNFINHDSDF